MEHLDEFFFVFLSAFWAEDYMVERINQNHKSSLNFLLIFNFVGATIFNRLQKREDVFNSVVIF